MIENFVCFVFICICIFSLHSCHAFAPNTMWIFAYSFISLHFVITTQARLFSLSLSFLPNRVPLYGLINQSTHTHVRSHAHTNILYTLNHSHHRMNIKIWNIHSLFSLALSSSVFRCCFIFQNSIWNCEYMSSHYLQFHRFNVAMNFTICSRVYVIFFSLSRLWLCCPACLRCDFVACSLIQNDILIFFWVLNQRMCETLRSLSRSRSPLSYVYHWCVWRCIIYFIACHGRWLMFIHTFKSFKFAEE